MILEFNVLNNTQVTHTAYDLVNADYPGGVTLAPAESIDLLGEGFTWGDILNSLDLENMVLAGNWAATDQDANPIAFTSMASLIGEIGLNSEGLAQVVQDLTDLEAAQALIDAAQDALIAANQAAAVQAQADATNALAENDAQDTAIQDAANSASTAQQTADNAVATNTAQDGAIQSAQSAADQAQSEVDALEAQVASLIAGIGDFHVTNTLQTPIQAANVAAEVYSQQFDFGTGLTAQADLKVELSGTQANRYQHYVTLQVLDATDTEVFKKEVPSKLAQNGVKEDKPLFAEFSEQGLVTVKVFVRNITPDYTIDCHSIKGIIRKVA